MRISLSGRFAAFAARYFQDLPLDLGRASKPVEIVERGQRRIRLGGGERQHQSFQADQGRAVQRHLPRTAAGNGHADVGEFRQRRVVRFRDQHGRQPQDFGLGEHRLHFPVQAAIGQDEQHISLGEIEQVDRPAWSPSH